MFKQRRQEIALNRANLDSGASLIRLGTSGCPSVVAVSKRGILSIGSIDTFALAGWPLLRTPGRDVASGGQRRYKLPGGCNAIRAAVQGSDDPSLNEPLKELAQQIRIVVPKSEHGSVQVTTPRDEQVTLILWAVYERSEEEIAVMYSGQN